MIYTCYEMIRDCRADRAEGWSYFIAGYVPVIRKLLAHYQPGPSTDAQVEAVLRANLKSESSLFQSPDATERWVVAELRQKMLAEMPLPTPAIPLDLETVAAALEPLTLSEKQVAWLETMRYSVAETGVLLRMAPTTVEKIRAKAAGLLRGKQDSWNSTILPDNGLELSRSAGAGRGEDCLSPKPFLDVLDGRATWSGREQLERHVTRCWYCIDHFCRLVEVTEFLRGIQPLAEAEVEPFRRLLGVKMEKRPVWKRLLGGGK